MRLIFLDRATLRYKDNATVSTEFEVVLDSVVKQKSNFKVDKEEIDASVGDIVVLKEGELSYIGIVQSVTRNEDRTSKVQLYDFRDVFDVKVPVSSFSGNVCQFLADTIARAFVSSGDPRQNLKYLTVRAESDVRGSLAYDEDTLIGIGELMETITKAYGVVVKHEVEFVRGRFSGIVVTIQQETHAVRLRHDLKVVSGLKIKESEENVVNKCVFYPKAENEGHRTQEEFYLLTDGSLTRDKDDERRFPYVSLHSAYYSDKEYGSLETKARERMAGSRDDHQITFDLDVSNNSFVPLGNVFLGYTVEFHGPKRTYLTTLTQIKYKNTFATCTLTLGEQRSSLTDKIKMMGGGTGGAKSTINVSASIDSFDGGIY